MANLFQECSSSFLVINEALEANNLSVSNIDMLIPHQANLRISQFIQKKFGLTDDQVYNNIQNTVIRLPLLFQLP
jgi:3-oxoacyl-[acyl-carrier-protein] synthase III